MKFILLILITLTLQAEIQLAPDGTYVNGEPQLTPDGNYVGEGNVELAPDGSYVVTVPTEPRNSTVPDEHNPYNYDNY